MNLTHYLSDSALSTASPGKITQNKPGASALSLCAKAEPPFTWPHPHFSPILPFPAPSPNLPLSVALTAAFPELRFHFVFFGGPRKLKLCIFVDQTSAASYYHWLLKGRVRWWLRLSWISFQKWWWIIALWIPVLCKYFCCLIFIISKGNWAVTIWWNWFRKRLL